MAAGACDYAPLRGAPAGGHPHPFIDVDALRMARVLAHVAALRAMVVLAGCGMRALARRPVTPPAR